MQPDPDNVGDYLISARSFDEYRAMFALTGSDLSGSVLDCPGQPRESLAMLVMAEIQRGSAHTAAAVDVAIHQG